MMDPVKMLRLVKNDDAFILDKLLKHDKINSSNFSSRHVSSSYKKQTDEIDKIPFNILIAEDNKINAELMKAIIESSAPQKFSRNEASVKFNIIIAEDGKKALDIVFSSINIDLIILDLMMPLINGFDLLEKIRSCSFGNQIGNIPVLIVSALNESSIISKGIELGANDYIAKPIVKNIFKSKVNSLINLKKLHDTLENSENIISNAFFPSSAIIILNLPDASFFENFCGAEDSIIAFISSAFILLSSAIRILKGILSISSVCFL